jgi:hypothetical protein
MSQKLFELIKGMTGHECQEHELDKIIQAVKEMDAPDGWLCFIPPKNIPVKFKWVAMDKDAGWFAYTQKPVKTTNSFVDAIGEWRRLTIHSNPNLNWEETLKEIPR